MPIPNRTTVRSVVSDWSARRPNRSPATPMSPRETRNTTSTVAMGNAAAMGLRKIASWSTMISRMVARKMSCSALSKTSWLSAAEATSPASPACRPVPWSRDPTSARRSLTAWMVAGSSAPPVKAILTSCTCLLGATA